MATQEIYKLLNTISSPPGRDTGIEAAGERNGQRLSALRDIVLRCETIDDEVLDRLEEVVSSDEETDMRVAALQAIVTILRRGPVLNDLAKRLLKFLGNDREEVLEEAATALAELEPAGQDTLQKNVRQAVLEALWARLGTAEEQPAAMNSIARAIFKIQAKDNTTTMLEIAFEKLASSDPQAYCGAVAFLKTDAGWHLLMSSADKTEVVQKLLKAFRAVSARDLLADIISLIVDITPGYPRLFELFLPHIKIPTFVFELDTRSEYGTPDPATAPAGKPDRHPDSHIIRWKQALFLADPRVRNFVNENILKRRIRLVLKEKEGAAEQEKITWFKDAAITTEKKEPELRRGARVKIIDRSAHSNWFLIETDKNAQGWIDATTELEPTVYSLTDDTKLAKEESDAILRCRYKILSLMLGELQDSKREVRQNMIGWLRECDQYFTPRERILVANALWECVMQYGQGLRAYAAIDLREEEQAMKEAVREIVYSHIDGKVIGLIGGLLLKEAGRELDELFETTDQKEAAQLKPQKDTPLNTQQEDQPKTQPDPSPEAGKESPPEAAKEAVSQAAPPPPPGKAPGYPHKERIMPFIVSALESSEEQVCQLALVWVYRRASGSRDEDYIPGSFVRDIVTRMRRLAHESEFPNVQRSAKTNLIPITEKNSKFLLKQFENKGALAVDIINELVEMDSSAVMNSLIRQWSYWIAETDKGQLVESASLELRVNRSAILPLLERLRDPLRFEDDEEAALKVKALHQAAPIYADLLLERYVLSPKELRWWRKQQEEEKKKEQGNSKDGGNGKDDEKGMTRFRNAPPVVTQPGTVPLVLPQTGPTLPLLNDWKQLLVDKGGKYSELEQMAKDAQWDDEKTMQEFAKLFWQRELDRRKTLVMGRVALQLAEMSSPRFFETEEFRDGKQNPTYIRIKAELRTHAVPYLAHRLPGEEDLTLREHMARTLANVGELEAVDALALAIVAEDRAKAIRQNVLAEYYLEPSKRRSDQAAEILDNAVKEATDTMRIIQKLSIATFVLGVVIVLVGIYLATQKSAAPAQQFFGLFASIGGVAGIITLLIKGPLNDIQNSIANLVQLETAFTNFIWELNLNSTYIQSEYVQEGVIGNDVVAATIGRMDGAMSNTINLIAQYTEDGRQQNLAHLTAVLPGSGTLPAEIKLLGEFLKVDQSRVQTSRGRLLVSINHKRTNAEVIAWEKDHVIFRLRKENLPLLENLQEPIWISLLVDGVETNGLPFKLTTTEPPKKPQSGNGSKMQPDVILPGAQTVMGGGDPVSPPGDPAAN